MGGGGGRGGQEDTGDKEDYESCECIYMGRTTGV